MKQPKHGRRLVLGAVGLTKLRNNRHEIAVLNSVRDDLEDVLIENGFFDSIPFTWISLIVRYGIKDAESPICDRVNSRYGDLPVSIEVRADRASKATIQDLDHIIRGAVTRAIISVGRQYGKDVRFLENLQST